MVCEVSLLLTMQYFYNNFSTEKKCNTIKSKTNGKCEIVCSAHFFLLQIKLIHSQTESRVQTSRPNKSCWHGSSWSLCSFYFTPSASPTLDVQTRNSAISCHLRACKVLYDHPLCIVQHACVLRTYTFSLYVRMYVCACTWELIVTGNHDGRIYMCMYVCIRVKLMRVMWRERERESGGMVGIVLDVVECFIGCVK